MKRVSIPPIDPPRTGNVSRETSVPEPAPTDAGYGTDRTSPPLLHPIGTCDWGGCTRPSTAWRFSDSHGWLPVCGLHQHG